MRQLLRLLFIYFALSGVVGHLAAVVAIGYLANSRDLSPKAVVIKGLEQVGISPTALRQKLNHPSEEESAALIAQLPDPRRWRGHGARVDAPTQVQLFDREGRPQGTLPADPGQRRLLLDGRPQYRQELRVSDGAQLLRALNQAEAGSLITLEPGQYELNQRSIRLPRGGNRYQPIIVRAEQLGQARIRLETLEGFVVSEPFWIFENLEIEGSCSNHNQCEHAFHIVGRADATILRNNRIFDFNAHIKGNGLTIKGQRITPDDVLIEGNSFFNTSVRETANSVTPIDVVNGQRWILRGNLIADFAKGRGNRISFAAFLKGESSDGLIDGNLVICRLRLWEDPGVRVGLSLGGGGTGHSVCPGGHCDYEHQGGVVRNNVVMHCPDDVGIYINKGVNTLIHNNLLYNTLGIDVRFVESNAELFDNLFDGRLKRRDGARAEEHNNLAGLSKRQWSDWFAAPEVGDFTLKRGDELVDRGTPLDAESSFKTDLCGRFRDLERPDIGPFEYSEPTTCPLIAGDIPIAPGPLADGREIKAFEVGPDCPEIYALAPYRQVALSEVEPAAAGSGYNVALEQLAPNRWHKIHQQRSDDAVRFRRQCHGGSAFDLRRNRLILFGSDTHGVDWSNSPLTFDLTTLQWARLYADDPPSSYQVNLDGYPVAGERGDHPWAMHTFGSVELDAARDQLIVASAPAHLVPGRFTDALSAVWGRIQSHPVWVLDLGREQWFPLAASGGRFFPFATAFDPLRGRVIGSRPDGIFELDRQARSWRKMAPDGAGGWHNNAAFDSGNDAMVILGDHRNSNDIRLYRPSSLAIERPPTPGVRPPRDQHLPMSYHEGINRVVALVDRRVYPDGRPAAHTETWLYDTASDRWEELESARLPFTLGMNYNLEQSPQQRLLLLVASEPDEATSVWVLRL